MTKIRLDEFRVNNFIDRFNAFFWVYVWSNAFGAFRRKNLLQLFNLVLILLVLLAYMPLLFITALSNLSEVIACGLDACQNDQIFVELGVSIALLILTFAPMLALMYIGTYYKIGDFYVVALLSEDKHKIGIHGLTGRRAGDNKKDPNRPGVLDTAGELAPTLMDYADEQGKKIVITANSPKLKERYMALMDLEEEKSFFGTKLVRYPKSPETISGEE